MSLSDRVREEIEDFHRHLVGWFTGESSPEVWDQAFAQRLGEGFRWNMPSGAVTSREDMLAGLRKAHGSNTDFRIRVEQVEVLQRAPGLLVATYVEWQRGARQAIRRDNGRRSTVVFRDQGDRLSWVHLHENWMPAASMDAADFSF